MKIKPWIADASDLTEMEIKGAQKRMWTALPGIVSKYSPGALTCEVQPALKGRRENEKGEVVIEPLPLLLDCPVVFPHAGGCSLTFPIRPGDECLVVFASRAIDGWWQQGGVQAAPVARMHDLSDGFVIPGPWSQAKKISGVSTSEVELRSDDGEAKVSVNPSTHRISIVTAGDVVQTVSGNVTETVSGTKTIAAPKIKFVGPVEMSSTLTVKGEINGNGINLSSHRHTGVKAGDGTSGGPVNAG